MENKFYYNNKNNKKIRKFIFSLFISDTQCNFIQTKKKYQFCYCNYTETYVLHENNNINNSLYDSWQLKKYTLKKLYMKRSVIYLMTNIQKNK